MSTVFSSLIKAAPHSRTKHPSPLFRVRKLTHATRVRFLHAEPNPARSGGGLSVSAVFTILAAIGVGATAYGVYEFYTSFAVWPKELRVDLRPAIKAQHQGDLTLSERYFRRAWEVCLALPKENLGVDPWLKISGIACKLGEVLEAANASEKAYDVYVQCFSLMRASAARNGLSMPERHRAIALALHLGELAEQLGKKEEEGEWLLWSVEDFIRIYHSNSGDSGLRHLDDLETGELTLPVWTHKNEFEAALEALGSWYAKQGNTEYALNLYLRAISVILPPSSPKARVAVSPQRRCRAAQLMTNISSLLIRDNPSPERLAQAGSWTSKGMEITEKARNELAQSPSPATEPECERVWAVLLYNMGAVLEMQDNREGAKQHYERALVHAQKINMREGVLEADDALARLSVSRDM